MTSENRFRPPSPQATNSTPLKGQEVEEGLGNHLQCPFITRLLGDSRDKGTQDQGLCHLQVGIPGKFLDAWKSPLRLELSSSTRSVGRTPTPALQTKSRIDILGSGLKCSWFLGCLS